MHSWRVVNDEVLYSDASPTLVSGADLETLKALAARNPRKRVRLCSHPDPQDPVHEMLIVHGYDAYVPPHRHVGKPESLHVVEGLATAVFFDDAGAITRLVPLGPVGSGRCFFYRIDEPFYHSLVIESEWLVFAETTKGPFTRDGSQVAQWAPSGENPEMGAHFLLTLREAVAARAAPVES